MKKQNKANLKVLHILGNNREINKIIKWTSKTIVNITITRTTKYYYYILQKQQLLPSNTTTTKKLQLKLNFFFFFYLY